MLVIAKKIKELFASTLDRKLISVRCASSMTVVINAKFSQLLAAHINENDDEKRRSPTTVPCFASQNTLTSTTGKVVADVQLLSQSWLCTQKTSVLYIFQRSTRANKNLNLW